jgi:hypothetical protein
MKQNVFSPRALAALARIFTSTGVRAVHEHHAWCVELNLDDDTAIMKSMGFRVRLVVPDIAVFLNRGSIRVELIKRGVPAHEAWLVKTRVGFDDLCRAFHASPEFTALKNVYDLPHLKTAMFRHNDGGVAQIVWRKKQVYPGLFDKK